MFSLIGKAFSTGASDNSGQCSSPVERSKCKRSSICGVGPDELSADGRRVAFLASSCGPLAHRIASTSASARCVARGPHERYLRAAIDANEHYCCCSTAASVTGRSARASPRRGGGVGGWLGAHDGTRHGGGRRSSRGPRAGDRSTRALLQRASNRSK